MSDQTAALQALLDKQEITELLTRYSENTSGKFAPWTGNTTLS